MYKIISPLIVLLFLGCKTDKNNNNEKEPLAVESKEDNFILSISAVVEQNDVFKLYYVLEDDGKISNKNMVKLDVSGNPTTQQDLIFITKTQEIPSKLFLMFGNEKKEQKISIKSGSVSLGSNSFGFNKDKFYQFFSPNKFLDYNIEDATALAKEINGEFKPWFRARNVLIDKMLFELD